MDVLSDMCFNREIYRRKALAMGFLTPWLSPCICALIDDICFWSQRHSVMRQSCPCGPCSHDSRSWRHFTPLLSSVAVKRYTFRKPWLWPWMCALIDDMLPWSQRRFVMRQTVLKMGLKLTGNRIEYVLITTRNWNSIFFSTNLTQLVCKDTVKWVEWVLFWNQEKARQFRKQILPCGGDDSLFQRQSHGSHTQTVFLQGGHEFLKKEITKMVTFFALDVNTPHSLKPRCQEVLIIRCIVLVSSCDSSEELLTFGDSSLPLIIF